MSAKFFGITECSFCKPVLSPSSLSLFLLLSLCLTVHFARVFRAALPSSTSPSSVPSHSVLLTPHCKNCNSILCDLLLPHCLPLVHSLPLFLPLLPCVAFAYDYEILVLVGQFSKLSKTSALCAPLDPSKTTQVACSIIKLN